MRIVPLGPAIEDSFLQFLKRDVIRNYHALLDLKYHRDKTNCFLRAQ